MTYRECYDRGVRALREAGIMEADLDARLLLEYVCHTCRNDLLVHGDRSVEQKKADQYQEMIGQRAGHIPLQHLTGVQEFMGLEFRVDKHVLIPRQDTEILVEEVLKNLHDGMRILDLCTGSGCILISLLRYSNDCTGVGVDLSPEALSVARENAGRLLGEPGMENLSMEKADLEWQLEGEREMEGQRQPEDGESARRIDFVESDLFERVEGNFDVVVSNPPYIAHHVIDSLMPEVREHEPEIALDGGEDGLLFYCRILENVKNCLKKGGMLFFEIGYDQAEAVSGLMAAAGFGEIQVVKDYGGLDRVIYGTLGFEI